MAKHIQFIYAHILGYNDSIDEMLRMITIGMHNALIRNGLTVGYRNAHAELSDAKEFLETYRNDQ